MCGLAERFIPENQPVGVPVLDADDVSHSCLASQKIPASVKGHTIHVLSQLSVLQGLNQSDDMVPDSPERRD